MVVQTPLQFDDFQPPDAQRLARMLRPLRWYFAPTLLGREHVDRQRPALFVGNHAIFGIIDSPLFVSMLYQQTGVFPRSLGDHFHFDVPGWGKLLLRYGAVPGTRANCSRLMQAGQHILVFPGGAREVAKRRSEINRLTWKKRTGFARMAISHGYDIIPFASVGCDESVDIVFDGDDFQRSRLGRWLLDRPRVNAALRNGDLFMPLVHGIGPTSLPRPEPFWFQIGKPISTQPFAGGENDPAVLWQLREQTAAAINDMIAALRQRRRQQQVSPLRRFWLRC